MRIGADPDPHHLAVHSCELFYVLLYKKEPEPKFAQSQKRKIRAAPATLGRSCKKAREAYQKVEKFLGQLRAGWSVLARPRADPSCSQSMSQTSG